MIDYDLFTWSDVQAAIQGAVDTWPHGFYSARAYWDEVVVEHATAAGAEVQGWLEGLFGPRWLAGPNGTQLRLESAPGQPPRALSIRLEPVDEERAPEGRARRSFALPDTAMRRIQWWSALEPLPVPVVGFHSFKGGVGRTTAALHLARLVTQRRDATVLLVDMDFEAPGITWMIEQSRVPSANIAMSDVLTLVHGTPPAHRHEIIELVVHKLKSATLGQLFVLPAIRSHQRALDIRPEHLESGEDYTITDTLAEIARALGAHAVIVDLRAGYSELAASLLLDPRVARVLVTTSAGQSIRGTKEMLSELYNVLPTREEDPALTVVISKVTQPHSDTYRRVRAELVEHVETMATSREEASLSVRFTANLHDDGLLSLPLAWEDASVCIAESATLDTGAIPVDLSFQQWSEELAPSIAPTQPSPASDLDARRKTLAKYASELVHAEGSGPGPFLDASFIKRLIGGHRRELPRVVAVGANGAGKTFTFLRMVANESWQVFASAARVATEVDAAIIPIAWPVNLRERAKAIIDHCYGSVGEADRRSSVLREARDEAKRTLSTSTEWRDWWLDRLVAAVGARSRDDLSSNNSLPPLFVIDGLEDFLPDVKDDGAEKKCLRALLQEVPAWLKATSSPCGLVVFVRADYVGAAIPQNTEQFRVSHQAYDLRWDREEALRLVQWIVQQAGALNTGEERSSTLLRLWGRKLGRDRSRAGITENWVLDALSTRQGEVQARDLVRLIADAASRSVGKNEWADRLLAPQSIRDALETVGQKKIEEIVEEQPLLGRALERFRALGGMLRVPFKPSELPSDEDRVALVRLEDAGIAWRDGSDIWLVSLYRRGLGIQLYGDRRERVLR